STHRRPPRPPPFPYTTLFRSDPAAGWRRLRTIPGVGSWTIQMLALTGQGRLDQLPAADVGYLKLVGRLRSGNPHERASEEEVAEDRKSTRLNSSHLVISYAVF